MPQHHAVIKNAPSSQADKGVAQRDHCIYRPDARKALDQKIHRILPSTLQISGGKLSI